MAFAPLTSGGSNNRNRKRNRIKTQNRKTANSCRCTFHYRNNSNRVWYDNCAVAGLRTKKYQNNTCLHLGYVCVILLLCYTLSTTCSCNLRKHLIFTEG